MSQRKQSSNPGKSMSKSNAHDLEMADVEHQALVAKQQALEAKLRLLRLQGNQHSTAPASAQAQRPAPAQQRDQHREKHGKECDVCGKQFEPEQKHFTKCPECFGSKSSVRIAPLCKFGHGCKNANCSFDHPKPAAARIAPSRPCKFGDECKNAQCGFDHTKVAAPAAAPAAARVDAPTVANFASRANPTAAQFHPQTSSSNPAVVEKISSASSSVTAPTANHTPVATRFSKPPLCALTGCSKDAEKGDEFCRSHRGR